MVRAHNRGGPRTVASSRSNGPDGWPVPWSVRDDPTSGRLEKVTEPRRPPSARFLDSGDPVLPAFLAVDFYCGAGGTTRGLLDAGGYVIAGVDNDHGCASTYRHNNTNRAFDQIGPRFLSFDMFPQSSSHPKGQQELVLRELRQLIPLYRDLSPALPLLFAVCAPCQSFTRFRQRQMTLARAASRMKDQSLLSQTLAFVAEFLPDLILVENVTGIKKGNSQTIWLEYQKHLTDMGYIVADDNVCASRFGVPQYRRSSIMFATRSTKECPVLQVPIDDPASPLRSVRDAIGNLPRLEAGESHPTIPNHVCRNLAEISRLRLKSLLPGESNMRLADSPYGDLSLSCHNRLSGQRRGFRDVYTRMCPDRPSPTITTRFISASNGRFGHFDMSQVRALSLREGALLQSFSADYRFLTSSMDQAARMIGNAVPPRLANLMARDLLSIWHQIHTPCDIGTLK